MMTNNARNMMAVTFLAKDIKIAIIGGGTGSFTLLTGLKEYTSALTALVNMADNGGSTGQLRDELGVLPPGDVRQCLVALSDAPKLRDLFNYRFDEGSLKGHAFGNLFLTALEKMTGNFAEGVEVAGEVLNITGSVEPITLTNVTLMMRTKAGETRGEFSIGESDLQGERPELWLEPEAALNPKALDAIKEADIVVVAPGSLYGSLAPALVIPGVGEALAGSTAFKVYVCNLVTKPGQTDGYEVSDFANEVERLAGTSFLDAVLFNTRKPSNELMEKYAGAGELAVAYTPAKLEMAAYHAYGGDLLAGAIWENTAGGSDPIASSRTLIRHDPLVVARSIIDLYNSWSKK